MNLLRGHCIWRYLVVQGITWASPARQALGSLSVLPFYSTKATIYSATKTNYSMTNWKQWRSPNTYSVFCLSSSVNWSSCSDPSSSLWTSHLHFLPLHLHIGRIISVLSSVSSLKLVHITRHPFAFDSLSFFLVFHMSHICWFPWSNVLTLLSATSNVLDLDLSNWRPSPRGVEKIGTRQVRSSDCPGPGWCWWKFLSKIGEINYAVIYIALVILGVHVHL